MLDLIALQPSGAPLVLICRETGLHRSTAHHLPPQRQVSTSLLLERAVERRGRTRVGVALQDDDHAVDRPGKGERRPKAPARRHSGAPAGETRGRPVGGPGPRDVDRADFPFPDLEAGTTPSLVRARELECGG